MILEDRLWKVFVWFVILMWATFIVVHTPRVLNMISDYTKGSVETMQQAENQGTETEDIGMEGD